MRPLLALLLLVCASPTQAQDLFNSHTNTVARLLDRVHASPADSADFHHFCAAFASTTPDLDVPTDLSAYRLIWDIRCEGGTALTRGNGTDLASFLKDPPELRFGVPVCCPSFHGGRYAVVHWEPPTGLVRFHYWFFERNEGHSQRPSLIHAPPFVFENAADSAAFHQFRKGLRPMAPDAPLDTAYTGLHLLWRVSMHGNINVVSRGDGSSPTTSELRWFSERVMKRTVEGKRVLMASEYHPCAITCITVRYYVEDPSAR